MTDPNFPDLYYGDSVEEYEAMRRIDPMWDREQELVEEFVSRLKTAPRILDAPIGTGRFLEIYANHKAQVTGLDLSIDMLQTSTTAAESVGVGLETHHGSILQLPFEDGRFDGVICFRLFTWFNETNISTAIGQLARIANGPLLISCNVRDRASFMRDPISNLKYLKMQLRQRQRKASGGPHVHVHHSSFLRSTFTSSGLEIVAEHLIKQTAVSQYVAWELRPTA
jgi:SAM-dependent methyltransferase